MSNFERVSPFYSRMNVTRIMLFCSFQFINFRSLRLVKKLREYYVTTRIFLSRNILITFRFEFFRILLVHPSFSLYLEEKRKTIIFFRLIYCLNSPIFMICSNIRNWQVSTNEWQLNLSGC